MALKGLKAKQQRRLQPVYPGVNFIYISIFLLQNLSFKISLLKVWMCLNTFMLWQFSIMWKFLSINVSLSLQCGQKQQHLHANFYNKCTHDDYIMYTILSIYWKMVLIFCPLMYLLYICWTNDYKCFSVYCGTITTASKMTVRLNTSLWHSSIIYKFYKCFITGLLYQISFECTGVTKKLFNRCKCFCATHECLLV